MLGYIRILEEHEKTPAVFREKHFTATQATNRNILLTQWIIVLKGDAAVVDVSRLHLFCQWTNQQWENVHPLVLKPEVCTKLFQHVSVLISLVGKGAVNMMALNRAINVWLSEDQQHCLLMIYYFTRSKKSQSQKFICKAGRSTSHVKGHTTKTLK